MRKPGHKPAKIDYKLEDCVFLSGNLLENLANFLRINSIDI
jgi:hypothetical protein